MMRVSVITVLCGFLLVLFSSCSPEVDVFADKEVPVVYGLLDSNADTNYIKITHTLNGADNALHHAQQSEWSNYPGKLDVRLTEFRDGDSIRQIILDTITIHNKQEGAFYAPSQKLYYTAERLGKNNPGTRYSYRLTVALPDGIVTAETDMVGSDDFAIVTSVVDFSGGHCKALKHVMVTPAVNACIYEVDMSFSFLERRTFDSDTLPRTVELSKATYCQSDLGSHLNDDVLAFSYRANDLYFALDRLLGDDTLVAGLRRYIVDAPVRVTVTAGGRSLNDYYYVNHLSHEAINGENTFTNINGGYGVFSSRMTVSRTMRLGGTTVPELVNNTKWGFKFIGGTIEE